jgi:hypothetical protein
MPGAKTLFYCVRLFARLKPRASTRKPVPSRFAKPIRFTESPMLPASYGGAGSPALLKTTSTAAQKLNLIIKSMVRMEPALVTPPNVVGWPLIATPGLCKPQVVTPEPEGKHGSTVPMPV